MSVDKRKSYLLNLTKAGCVDFEGNETTRVFGSGKANLGEKSTNVDDVWFIEGLSHNTLTLNQMIVWGKDVIFNSKGCIFQK